MAEPYTNGEFARSCSYLASRIAAWGGDTLSLPDYDKPVRPGAVQTFVSDMRDRLDYIERRASIQEATGRTR